MKYLPGQSVPLIDTRLMDAAFRQKMHARNQVINELIDAYLLEGAQLDDLVFCRPSWGSGEDETIMLRCELEEIKR